MEKFADQNCYSQGLQTSKYEHSDEEYRDCQHRDHQDRKKQNERNDRKNITQYDSHEIARGAHSFDLPMDVNNSVFKRAFTFEIAAFEIHVDVFSSTTRAHRPVIVHKPNGLAAVITGSSFLHHVKAHTRSISRGYCTVFRVSLYLCSYCIKIQSLSVIARRDRLRVLVRVFIFVVTNSLNSLL